MIFFIIKTQKKNYVLFSTRNQILRELAALGTFIFRHLQFTCITHEETLGKTCCTYLLATAEVKFALFIDLGFQMALMFEKKNILAKRNFLGDHKFTDGLPGGNACRILRNPVARRK